MYFSFEKGDVFTVLNEMGDQWLWVKSQATGDHGQIHEVLVEDLVSFFYDRERERAGEGENNREGERERQWEWEREERKEKVKERDRGRVEEGERREGE
jgi:hypothetical protein